MGLKKENQIMEAVNQAQKKYSSMAMTISILAGLVFILIGLKPVGKGLILGTIFSVINFIMIAQTLPLRISRSKKKTFLFSIGSIVFRYAILALPIIAAVKYEQFNLPAAVCGIFMIQLIIMADHLLNFTTRNG